MSGKTSHRGNPLQFYQGRLVRRKPLRCHEYRKEAIAMILQEDVGQREAIAMPLQELSGRKRRAMPL